MRSKILFFQGKIISLGASKCVVSVNGYTNNYVVKYVNIHPIKLTEEWLIKLGFEEYKDFGYKTKQFDLIPLQGFSYNLKTKKVMIMQKGNIQSHWLENEIKYVHQLQNLYFALTGSELQVNVA